MRPIAIEEPSEKVDPVEHPETPQTKDEEGSSDDTDVLQPETLVKVMKKLTINPHCQAVSTSSQPLSPD